MLKGDDSNTIQYSTNPLTVLPSCAKPSCGTTSNMTFTACFVLHVGWQTISLFLLTKTAAKRLSFKAMSHLGWALHEAWRCERLILFRGERLDPKVELAAAEGQAIAMVSAQICCAYILHRNCQQKHMSAQHCPECW